MTTDDAEKRDDTTLALILRVEKEYDADLIVYFGMISREWDDHIIDRCKECKKRRNVILMLTTLGGTRTPPTE